MLETLFGSTFGLISRLLPEVLKWLDRKSERAHELAMLDKQIQADRLRADQNLALEASRQNSLEIDALIAATKAQGRRTGVDWIDALSALMRPMITFWWVIVLYTVHLFAEYHALLQQGASLLEAIPILWGAEEKAIVASIIAFWFVDRTLRKQ
jgi:hypothetical protein